jgi:NAD(P)-dependent dehydrogenase (short-subunit alcohol dehydrogenase family)
MSTDDVFAVRHLRHVVIGGGSGFIGSALTRALTARGDRVTIISRTPGPERMTWDDLAQDGIPACDAVVNFAGQHILNLKRRWTPAYRDEVIQSRVQTTRRLVEALNASANPPEVFVSTAGKCFYGTRELGVAETYPELDEESQPMGLDFPAELVSLWEAAADAVDATRFGAGPGGASIAAGPAVAHRPDAGLPADDQAAVLPGRWGIHRQWATASAVDSHRGHGWDFAARHRSCEYARAV